MSRWISMVVVLACGLALGCTGCTPSAPTNNGNATNNGGEGGSTATPKEEEAVIDPTPVKDSGEWASPATGKNKGEILIDGSSTVFPLAEAVAEEFRKGNSSINTTIGIAGTGGGFKRFHKGETDISNASRPILTKEIDECKKGDVKYIELPVCFDALTIAVHPKNDWCQSITVEELHKLWAPAAEGKVMKWSDVREGWPDEKISLYGAGSDSGTFDYFTEAVNGKAKESRIDYTASEDDNTLVQGISKNKYALGYLPFAYFSSNRDILKAVAVVPKDGKEGVMPSMKNVQTGVYTPLSRPLFIYVNVKSLERQEVRDFALYFLLNSKELANEINYLPLPNKSYEGAIKRLKEFKTGSVFGGVPETGVTIEALLERELKE